MGVARAYTAKISAALIATVVLAGTAAAETAGPYPVVRYPLPQQRPVQVETPSARTIYEPPAPAPMVAPATVVSPRAQRCRGMTCPAYILLGTSY